MCLIEKIIYLAICWIEKSPFKLCYTTSVKVEWTWRLNSAVGFRMAKPKPPLPCFYLHLFAHQRKRHLLTHTEMLFWSQLYVTVFLSQTLKEMFTVQQGSTLRKRQVTNSSTDSVNYNSTKCLWVLTVSFSPIDPISKGAPPLHCFCLSYNCSTVFLL